MLREGTLADGQFCTHEQDPSTEKLSCPSQGTGSPADKGERFRLLCPVASVAHE